MTRPYFPPTVDDLTVARAHGDHLVHLARPAGSTSLCGSALRTRPPQRSFREAGCPACLQGALSAGTLVAMERDRAWINLGRIEPATIGNACG